MSALAEALSQVVGRVEILARGADGDRRAAEEALAADRPLEARARARELLAKVPETPIGLVLWADAAESLGLYEEAVRALRALVSALPWRADAWLRLGRAHLALGEPRAREALERAATAPSEPAASREALMVLCDLDLERGEPVRALRWLDRIPTRMDGGVDYDVLMRRAEGQVALGNMEAASELFQQLPDALAIDGRSMLLAARVRAHEQPTLERIAHPVLEAATRAFVLEQPGSEAFLAHLASYCRDAVQIAAIRDLVSAAGRAELPLWQASFAFAEGRRSDARTALAEAYRAGDRTVEGVLRALAVEAEDADALTTLVPDALPDGLAAVRSALEAIDDDPAAALAALDAAWGEGETWARTLRRRVFTTWLDGPGASWDPILGELRQAARDLDALGELQEIEDLSLQRSRPIVLSVVGEFNAGKSTFINALLGEDVAPTGVIPTTASLHHLSWAPDPFARIELRQAPDRIVVHDALKRTLKELQRQGDDVEKVHILAPIERLKRVEIFDTPGFNAPDPSHRETALRGLAEAHAVLWLFDATSPLKESERQVLSSAERASLPTLAVVNKCDRIGDAQAVDKVRGYVADNLTEHGLTLAGEPIALSAKLALEGRQGDAAALDASGWAHVESALAEHVVDRASELREAAMRRRALRLVAGLFERAEARLAEERGEREIEQARRLALHAAADRIYAEHRELKDRLADGLLDAQARLAEDLAPALAATPEQAELETSLSRYASHRAAVLLGPPAVTWLETALGVELSRAVAVQVAAVFAGAPAADRGRGLATKSLGDVCGAVLDRLAERLVEEATAPLPALARAARLERLRALSDALSGDGNPAASRRGLGSTSRSQTERVGGVADPSSDDDA